MLKTSPVNICTGTPSIITVVLYVLDPLAVTAPTQQPFLSVRTSAAPLTTRSRFVWVLALIRRMETWCGPSRGANQEQICHPVLTCNPSATLRPVIDSVFWDIGLPAVQRFCVFLSGEWGGWCHQRPSSLNTEQVTTFILKSSHKMFFYLVIFFPF